MVDPVDELDGWAGLGDYWALDPFDLEEYQVIDLVG